MTVLIEIEAGTFLLFTVIPAWIYVVAKMPSANMYTKGLIGIALNEAHRH